MSRTDKDRPHWVQNAEIGVISHDHRTGECIVQDPREPWNFWRRHAWKHCKKYVAVEWQCTKAEPHRDRHGRQTCWKGYYEWPEPGSTALPRFVWIQCTGHKRRDYDESIPCSCDDEPPAATCSVAWSLNRFSAPPKWYRDYEYHSVQRRRERDELGEFKKRFNADGWLAADEWDFESPQAKSGAKYSWW